MVQPSRGFAFLLNFKFRAISHENKAVAQTTLRQITACACAVQPTPAQRLSGQSAWGEGLGVDPKWSRPPRCYIRPEDHDVQTEVPDRVGGNRWRISTTAGDHNPQHYTQSSLALFFAAPARHGWRRHPVAVPAVLLWIAPFQSVIHSRPGRKRSIAPGCGVLRTGYVPLKVHHP